MLVSLWESGISLGISLSLVVHLVGYLSGQLSGYLSEYRPSLRAALRYSNQAIWNIVYERTRKPCMIQSGWSITGFLSWIRLRMHPTFSQPLAFDWNVVGIQSEAHFDILDPLLPYDDLAKRVLGNGRDICFWTERWTKDTVLAIKFPLLYRLARGKENPVGAMGEWWEGRWCWAFCWRRGLLQREARRVDELLDFLGDSQPDDETEDGWRWEHTKSE
ncbi:hypothetical protein Ancab_004504, partial [Ancistrocladus abbreviatus]